MSVVVSAVVGSTVVGVYSSNKASKTQAAAAREGAAQQRVINDENVALQRELAQTQREDFAPWRETGEKALQQIFTSLNDGTFNVNANDIDVTQDPSYQFRLSESQKAIDRRGSAGGNYLSGAQLKAMNNYTQDYASQEWASAYNREQNEKNRRFNMLAGLSDQGQASAAGQAGATSRLASNAGEIMRDTARSVNQGTVAAGTARADGYRDVAAALNQGAENWLTYKKL